MKFLLLSLFVFSINAAHAGVEAFSSTSEQKLFIEEGMKSGKEVYYIQFKGVKGNWSDKVFKVKRTKRASDLYTYSFDYKLDLSSGKQDRTYGLVTEEGYDFIKGSQVKRVKLWTPDFAKDGVTFTYDKDLTKSSQSLNLESTGKKKPFVPEIY